MLNLSPRPPSIMHTSHLYASSEEDPLKDLHTSIVTKWNQPPEKQPQYLSLEAACMHTLQFFLRYMSFSTFSERLWKSPNSLFEKWCISILSYF